MRETIAVNAYMDAIAGRFSLEYFVLYHSALPMHSRTRAKGVHPSKGSRFFAGEADSLCCGLCIVVEVDVVVWRVRGGFEERGGKAVHDVA